MGIDGAFKGMDLSLSGLMAEQKRMNVIMENVANANVTRLDPNDPDSGPYVRRRVFFAEALANKMEATGGGVVASDPVADRDGEFPRVHDPGHADADEEGFVSRSNVNLVFEMLDLANAKSSFEANLSTFKTWADLTRSSINLMRS